MSAVPRELEEMKDGDVEHYVIGWITGEILGIHTPRQQVARIRALLHRYHSDRVERGRKVGANLTWTQRYVDALKP
jgi:hypothetical protein